MRTALFALLLAAAGCTSTPPPPPPAPEPQPVRVRLLFAGDVMQHMPQVRAAQLDTTFDYTEVFAAVRPRFEAADLAVVNLETTLTRSGRYTGYPLFRSPVELADALREAGVDVALTANNHCCDGGAEGIRTTARELDRCGILRTGSFVDSLDRAGRHPLLVERRGVRFALLCYTYGTNGMPVPRGMEVNLLDTLRMAGDLAAAQRAGADCIVACVHWGNEYERRENASQRALAAFLRRHGADLVVGSHPHVVQPAEADSTHVTLYSLGNFVSNQRKRYTDGGIMAAIEATKHPDGRMTYRLECIPVWVALPGYRILPPEAIDSAALPAAYRIFRADLEQLPGL
ncbi:CapA family protein [uncultured Alistipes sp.]|uniref:CapA family protein n=1 Tax=uncultured Alistipes sp. TaxID=538949 RepID=UPI00342E1D74